jgi:Second Messenger Oligonucleotide or Dinucleotide Synthetase domain
MDRLDDPVQDRARALALSDDQLARIERGLRDIAGWLGRDATILGDAAPSLYTQGSVSLRTSIVPKKQGGFDADLVCELNEPAAWIDRPRTAFDVVGQRLREMPELAGEVRQKKRCWAVVHDGVFHVDVTPAIRSGPAGSSEILVFDGERGRWKPSNPRAFSAWFCGRAAIDHVDPAPVEPLTDGQWRSDYARETPLAAAVQLLKRRRDLTFRPGDPEPSSIVLTTLAGRGYAGARSAADALGGMLRAIESELAKEADAVISLRNPVLDAEVLSETWVNKGDALDAFRQFIGAFRRGFDAVLAARDRDAADRALDDLFGARSGEA